MRFDTKSIAVLFAALASIFFSSCSQKSPDGPPREAVGTATARLAPALNITRVSVSAAGAEAHGPSYVHAGGHAISADGRFVVFASLAQDLVPGQQNQFTQIYVKDLGTGEVARVSGGIDGLPANAESCCGPVISGDGNVVAFQSAATNLVPNDTNGADDVFVHDRATGVTTRVSVATSGAEGNAQSYFSALSSDGQFVAFGSVATNFDASFAQGVFVRDRHAGTTERASDPSASATGAAISANGRYVAFLDTPAGQSFITVRDRVTGVSTRLIGRPVASGAHQLGLPEISADGAWLAFDASAPDIVPGDTNGVNDVFLLNRASGATVHASAAQGGGQSNGASTFPTLSSDGRFVAFGSLATNLVPSVSTPGVFLFDRVASAITFVADGGGPSVNSDGRAVAFSSGSSTLVPNDTNGVGDVFAAAAPIVGTISGIVIGLDGSPIAGATVTNGPDTATTGTDGRFSFPNLPAGSYTVRASQPGFTFGSSTYVESHYTVTIPPATPPFLQIVGYDKPPIVYVHGAFGDPDNFYDVPERLESAGYYPQLVKLDTSAVFTAPLTVNAERVLDGVDQARDVTGQPKVIIVAHSMGGLVARSYLESPLRSGDRVSALYTFGTPHDGIPLVSSVVISLDCLLQPGVCEMMHPYIDLFNVLHLPRADVDYHSIGGDAPMWRMARKCFRIFRRFCVSYPWPDLRYRNGVGWGAGVLIQGPDDAFIGTASSTAMHPFTFNVDRWVTDEVHFAPSLGDRFYFQWNGDLSKQSYDNCLKPVLVDQSRGSCGLRVFAPPASPTTTLASAAAPDVAPPALGASVALNDGVVRRGERIARTVRVEGGRVVFLAKWDAGTSVVTVVDPMGRVFDRASVEGQALDPNDPGIDPSITTVDPDTATFTGAQGSAAFDFPNARPGNWQLVINGGDDLPTAGTRFASTAAFDSPLRLSASIDRNWYAPGTTARIVASFTAAPATAQVTASVVRGDGLVDRVTLASIGNGSYAASYRVPSVAGRALVRIVATGTTTAGAPFERGELAAFLITTNTLSLTGTYSDRAEPRPSNPALSQAIHVTVGIRSTIEGAVALAGDLVDGSGKRVAHALTEVSVTTSTQSLTLRFDGADVYASRANGPYTVSGLLLVDQRGAMIVAAEAQNAHRTAAYDYRRFAPFQQVPSADPGGPYTVAEGSSVKLAATGTDPEGDALTFAWDLDNDGSFETAGATVNFAAAALDGPTRRVVRVRAMDPGQHSAVASTFVDVTNVAPRPSVGADASLDLGQTFRRTGSFTDPGSDSWTATVDYGDGSGPVPLTTSGRSFSLDHSYARAGSYTVEVRVVDDDDGIGTDALVITVVAPVQAWQPNVTYAIRQLVTFNGITYECRQAHTSLTGWEPPNTLALWQRPTPPSGSGWTTNTSYPLGIDVTFVGRPYRCRQTHTSQPGSEPPNAPALWNPL